MEQYRSMVGGRGHGEECMSRLGPIILLSTVHRKVYAAKTQWPGGFNVQCRTVFTHGPDHIRN